MAVTQRRPSDLPAMYHCSPHGFDCGVRASHFGVARATIMDCTRTETRTVFAQAQDFQAESAAFADFLTDAVGLHGDRLFDRPTLFKQWTLDDILSHLHVWNRAADAAYHDQPAFHAFVAQAAAAFQRGHLRAFERQWLDALHGPALLDTWRDFAHAMAGRFANVDPTARVPWVGPDMSVKSCLTARQMETWAHAQAVYDLLGVTRAPTDRLRNIVVLGVNTFGWTFVNRGQPVPDRQPRVELIAPSGQTWSFGDKGVADVIRGSAEAFCQVVTQVRNVADTDLEVVGDTAQTWMGIAQCFAGAPETPPQPGERRLTHTVIN